MTKIVRLVLSAALAVSLAGCFYGPRYHRHWHEGYYGHAGYGDDVRALVPQSAKSSALRRDRRRSESALHR